MIEMPAFSNRFAVRGTSFVAENVAQVCVGDDVCLDPEPTNEHDPRAIRVCVRKGNQLLHLGYVPREHCEVVHGLLATSNMWNTRIHSVQQDGQTALLMVTFDSTRLLGRQASVSM